LYKDLNILCVEDESGVRKRVVNTLAYYFNDVYEASNGKEGLNSYYENQPDVILCDIQMPIMSGIEMIKKIREEDILIPIILLTAHNSEEYLMELINLQVQHFILKPINAQNLEEALSNALKGKYRGIVKIKTDIFLDIDRLLLQAKGKNISLSPREVKFLTLISNKAVVSYNKIEEELWQGKEMSSGALKSFVRDLRKKLPQEMIENIAQVGYKLI
jgi:DNA-binding response OmpR family regulator